MSVNIKVHYPHPYDPIWRPEIIRVWTEQRKTHSPIEAGRIYDKTYVGTFCEYTYINKKKKKIHVDEFCLLVKWDK